MKTDKRRTLVAKTPPGKEKTYPTLVSSENHRLKSAKQCGYVTVVPWRVGRFQLPIQAPTKGKKHFDGMRYKVIFV